MSELTLRVITLGYIVIGVITADLFLHFLAWQEFSWRHRRLANQLKAPACRLALYYVTWLFVWPVFVVSLLPFVVLWVYTLLKKWWCGRGRKDN